MRTLVLLACLVPCPLSLAAIVGSLLCGRLFVETTNNVAIFEIQSHGKWNKANVEGERQLSRLIRADSERSRWLAYAYYFTWYYTIYFRSPQSFNLRSQSGHVREALLAQT
mmetsp:Transcript_55751/g.135082  ORF Transcript_55751/g.135082 Transcript_55751/m.135082 type:complete len:111 (-) Transcript_55751:1807-2139(-)